MAASPSPVPSCLRHTSSCMASKELPLVALAHPQSACLPITKLSTSAWLHPHTHHPLIPTFPEITNNQISFIILSIVFPFRISKIFTHQINTFAASPKTFAVIQNLFAASSNFLAAILISLFAIPIFLADTQILNAVTLK